MGDKKYIITGINRLTGRREQLSRPMSEQEAKDRFERERRSRGRQRYQPYSRLKIERLIAVQLTLQFKDYE